MEQGGIRLHHDTQLLYDFKHRSKGIFHLTLTDGSWLQLTKILESKSEVSAGGTGV